MAIKKKDAAILKDLTRQAVAFLRGQREHTLPYNKNRARREGNGCPLSAWMRGAKCAGSQSRILSVLDGKARYPYKTFSASREVLCDRIAHRYKLVGAAVFALHDHIAMHYRGGKSDYVMLQKSRPDSSLESPIALRAYTWLIQCAEGKPIPLRAILSPNLADMVLLFSLYEALGDANGR